ncbi:hypothetical protein EVAR_59220_1 [Eumeta japonica]|uniref:Uncharacterized protein n=1 Tax=Eumeta variegata TaxID=151549 RepID=A0A4C1YSW8_EUMVA|nr:hypothetical protein EVAR_59220_1 [Eumeta japonica]
MCATSHGCTCYSMANDGTMLGVSPNGTSGARGGYDMEHARGLALSSRSGPFRLRTSSGAPGLEGAYDSLN